VSRSIGLRENASVTGRKEERRNRGMEEYERDGKGRGRYEERRRKRGGKDIEVGRKRDVKGKRKGKMKREALRKTYTCI